MDFSHHLKGSFTNGDKSIFVEIEISTDMDTPSTPARAASNRSDIPITVPSKNCDFRPLHQRRKAAKGDKSTHDSFPTAMSPPERSTERNGSPTARKVHPTWSGVGQKSDQGAQRRETTIIKRNYPSQTVEYSNSASVPSNSGHESKVAGLLLLELHNSMLIYYTLIA